MRRGKQKVRLSSSVVEIDSNNKSVVRKTKRSSAGRKKSKVAEEDPLALPSRRTKTVKTKAARKQPSQPVEYEVEKIVGHRQSAGQTVYRIRWKGWAAKDDTWQAEDDLSCGAILKKYKSEMTAASASPKKEGRGRPAKPAASTPTKKRKSVGSRGVAHGKVTKTGRPRKTEASKGRKSLSLKPKKKVGRKPKQDKEWEVEEVVAVRTTEKGKEEFYIKWKGYSSDENTWEPAANVANCNRAVERFRMTQGDEEDEGTSALPSDGDAEEPKTNGTTKEKDTDADDDDEENGKEQNKSSSLTADGE